MFKRVMDSSDASYILHTETMSPKERRMGKVREKEKKEEMKEKRKKGEVLEVK